MRVPVVRLTAHVRGLMRLGMSYRAIAEASGCLSKDQVARIGRAEVKDVDWDDAQALLEVEPRGDELHPCDGMTWGQVRTIVFDRRDAGESRAQIAFDLQIPLTIVRQALFSPRPKQKWRLAQ